MIRAVFALISCAAGAMAQDAGGLVGRWRSVETSKGGIGAMYDFLADGTVRFSPGAIVPEAYRVEGDRLIFPSDGTVYVLSWPGDGRLRMTVSGQGSVEYMRLGARQNRETDDSQAKLLGEWTGMQSMGDQKVLAHWIFGADSNALLMMRFYTESGSYTVQNGRLTASFGGKPGLDGAIGIVDGVLSIDRGGARVTRLKRY